SSQYPVKYAWGTEANVNAVGGNYLQERYPGATESFSFTGTSVGLTMWMGPARGTATVTISDTSPVTQVIDTYQATTGDKTFSWSGLANIKHTVKLTVNGANNPPSTGVWIGLDAIQVNGSPATPGLTATWSDGPGFGYRFTGQKGAA